jgi:hypothetical protein
MPIPESDERTTGPLRCLRALRTTGVRLAEQRSAWLRPMDPFHPKASGPHCSNAEQRGDDARNVKGASCDAAVVYRIPRRIQVVVRRRFLLKIHGSQCIQKNPGKVSTGQRPHNSPTQSRGTAMRRQTPNVPCSTTRIQEGKVALVFRNGNYKRALKAGDYFVRPFDEVKLYDTAYSFTPPMALELLLRDAELASMLTIVEVGDNQVVLKYRNGNFQEVLKPGRYAFFNSLMKLTFITMDLGNIEITKEIDRDLLMKPALLPYIRVYSVEPYELGMLMVNGEAKAELKPGTYFFAKNSTVVQVLKADLRLLQLESERPGHPHQGQGRAAHQLQHAVPCHRHPQGAVGDQGLREAVVRDCAAGAA